ncbi:DotA/TraY family protein, partial [Aeromonas veronii]
PTTFKWELLCPQPPRFTRRYWPDAYGAARITTEQAAGGTLSHMTQMRALGDNILWAAESSLLAVAGASGVAGAKAAEWTVGLGFSLREALAAAGGTITMLIVSMMGLGLMLSVYISLIPAMVWTMAVLNWLLSVVEAVIAAPLFAAAHISPYGEEEIGTAGEGYRMLASLVIKPMLMVIAVFVAIGLCNAMSGVVNDMFMPMVAGAQSGSVVGIVKFVGIVSVYVLLMMGLTGVSLDIENYCTLRLCFVLFRRPKQHNHVTQQSENLMPAICLADAVLHQALHLTVPVQSLPGLPPQDQNHYQGQLRYP